MWLALSLAIVVALAGLGSARQKSYEEILVLQPLKGRMLLSSFDFKMQQSVEESDLWGYNGYTTISRSLGQILDKTNTYELHLRFGHGWWNAESWGPLPLNGTFAAGIGVEIWAWVAGSTQSEAQANWHHLVNSLSGYFCASLNFVDRTQTTYPSNEIFKPTGDIPKDGVLLRGALPGEPICTENLTPFLKMLPCKSYAGIGSLLDGHYLFDSQWQSMSVDVDVKNGTRRLRQIISTVFDTDRILSKDKNALPRPLPFENLMCDKSKPWANDFNCLPISPISAIWKTSKLFGQKIRGRCPLAGDGPHIVLKAPDSWKAHIEGKSWSSHDITLEEGPLDLLLETDNVTDVLDPGVPELLVDRSLTGYDQQRGGLHTVFTNLNSKPVRVIYFESIPWFIRTYLHTLKVNNGKILRTSYLAGEDRVRPSQLELAFEIPAYSKMVMEYKFEKSLLYYEEYPPDANHGFEIAPGVAVVETGYVTRTTSLLVSLPTPDFSMPYNVIILTCTVITFAFGTIFNLLVKRVVPESIGEQVVAQKPLGQLISKMRKKISKKKKQ